MWSFLGHPGLLWLSELSSNFRSRFPRFPELSTLVPWCEAIFFSIKFACRVTLSFSTIPAYWDNTYLKCTSQFTSFLIVLWFKFVSVKFMSDICYLWVLMRELFVHGALVGWSQRVWNMLYNFVALGFWATEGFHMWLWGLCTYLVRDIIVIIFLTCRVIAVFSINYFPIISIIYCWDF